MKVRLNPDIKEESEELRKMLLSEKTAGKKKEFIFCIFSKPEYVKLQKTYPKKPVGTEIR
jgi:hypothetical protein